MLGFFREIFMKNGIYSKNNIFSKTRYTRVRNRAKNPIMFRARFFVHFISQPFTIVHEKCTIFFVLNKKIVQNRANAKP